MVINKEIAIQKWKPVLNSTIKDAKKLELICTYCEYRSHFDPSLSYGISLCPSTTNIPRNISLASEILILKNIELENKIVIMRGVNNDKIYFENPHPLFKFTLIQENINSDIKSLRKNKLKTINNGGMTTNVINPSILDNNMNSLIISDINYRLKNGNILYIDEELIHDYKMNTCGEKQISEVTVRYDVI
jgi:hypothetical protein